MLKDPEPTEFDVDAVVEEFAGDLRAAIRALLRDIAVLAADYEGDVSRGYVRGEDPGGLVRLICRRRTGGE